MTEETKQTEPTPDIAALFDAFCKQHGVTPMFATEAPTGHLIPAVNILAMRWPLKIVFEKTQV